MISCWMRTVWKDESRFMEALGMGKDLSEMTLEDLWELFPIFLVALKKETGEKHF